MLALESHVRALPPVIRLGLAEIAFGGLTFDTAGTFPYQCTLHPQDMQGTVEVTTS